MKWDWRQLMGRKTRANEVRDMEKAPTEAYSYAREYVAAFHRAHSLGLRTPIRLVMEHNCVDMSRTMPVLLDYFTKYRAMLFGRTATIHTDLQQALLEATGVPFNLTIGWMELEGKPIFRHDIDQISRFLCEKRAAYDREGVPFHIWLTSPALEILDLTFAMNLGWAKTAKDCEGLVVYQPVDQSHPDRVYHPMLVGDDFFQQTGAMAVVTNPAPARLQ